MAKSSKNRASKQNYVSQDQLGIEGFESPFSRKLNPKNRWVVLSRNIPWDILVSTYNSALGNSKTGAASINARVAIGSVIIKHICDLSDRETVQQIQENMYMQFFLGYSSFTDEPPFDPSLFVEFRKRLGVEQINKINELILGLGSEGYHAKSSTQDRAGVVKKETLPKQDGGEVVTHFGKMITDATACPQDIAYPTDLNLLNDAREKSQLLIDTLYKKVLHKKKPRTDRKKARKEYLQTAQKKVKSKKAIHNAVKKQLAYLRRNISSIHKLWDSYQKIPLDRNEYKYLLVIQTLYDQQKQMFDRGEHSVDNRIVSIHQPHVRPIVRGKTNAKTEFGAKIQATVMNGYTFLDELSWEAFNEGTCLISSVEKYKVRFGFYPEYVLADKIYCTRANRKVLKDLSITLRAKPLGRPKAVDEKHVSPGERNPIEGKFGQAKTAYGLNRIKARLQATSQSWIASIILVLNLVKLAGEALLCHVVLVTYSARQMKFEPWLRNRQPQLKLAA
ncbi:IS5 family transposase [Dyadobacter frigoris]|nr:IS5 family transposase [Dyadobacter frigoris]